MQQPAYSDTLTRLHLIFGTCVQRGDSGQRTFAPSDKRNALVCRRTLICQITSAGLRTLACAAFERLRLVASLGRAHSVRVRECQYCSNVRQHKIADAVRWVRCNGAVVAHWELAALQAMPETRGVGLQVRFHRRTAGWGRDRSSACGCQWVGCNGSSKLDLTRLWHIRARCLQASPRRVELKRHAYQKQRPPPDTRCSTSQTPSSAGALHIRELLQPATAPAAQHSCSPHATIDWLLLRGMLQLVLRHAPASPCAPPCDSRGQTASLCPREKPCHRCPPHLQRPGRAGLLVVWSASLPEEGAGLLVRAAVTTPCVERALLLERGPLLLVLLLLLVVLRDVEVPQLVHAARARASCLVR